MKISRDMETGISLLLLFLGFFGYLGFLIYWIVELKKLHLPLNGLMAFNSRAGIVAVSIGLLITKCLARFYFQKRPDIQDAYTFDSKPVWCLDKVVKVCTGIALASMLWVIPFMGLIKQ
ncbi:hypothetical protein [Eikenella longinqua]|nr:hypothetical protein [Eikenella longinqua]